MSYLICSIDQSLWQKTQLTESIHYSVHSRFLHAINFVNDQAEMITFLSKELPSAPNTAVIDCVDFAVLDIADNARLVLTKEGFKLVNLFFKLNLKTQIWISELPMLSVNNIASTQIMIESFLQEECEELSSIEKAIYEKLDALYEIVFQAYYDQDFSLLTETMKKTIGLGLGLTPSGDDRLIGFLLGCYVCEFNKTSLLASIQSAIDDAKDRTNDISYAMLKEAREGRFNEWLLDLTYALKSSNQEQLADAMIKVFSIGSRSGGDMLQGFLLFLLLKP